MSLDATLEVSNSISWRLRSHKDRLHKTLKRLHINSSVRTRKGVIEVRQRNDEKRAKVLRILRELVRFMEEHPQESDVDQWLFEQRARVL